MRRLNHSRAHVLVLLAIIFLLFTAGEIAAEAAKSGIGLPSSPGYCGDVPDTLASGPPNPGHEGDPNDYDRTDPTAPLWIWVVTWMVGIGR